MPCGYVYFRWPARERMPSACQHILREASARCPFYYEGQFQGLNKRNGQQVRLSRNSFFINPLHSRRVSPEALKTKMKKILSLVVAAGCLATIEARADDGSLCLIFSGGAGQERVFDLNQFNRITFGSSFMTVSGSSDTENKVELLYSAFHHISVENRLLTGIDEVSAQEDTAFLYNKTTSSLIITAPKEIVYNVGVFTTDGVMKCHAEMRGGDIISIEALPSGFYIAVATGGNDIHTIKFVK